MAAITRLMPSGVSGRPYGSFAGKAYVYVSVIYMPTVHGVNRDVEINDYLAALEARVYVLDTFASARPVLPTPHASNRDAEVNAYLAGVAARIGVLDSETATVELPTIHGSNRDSELNTYLAALEARVTEIGG